LIFLKAQRQRLAGRFYCASALPAAFSVGSFLAQNGLDESALTEICGGQGRKQMLFFVLNVDDAGGKELLNGR